jgi:RNA polymerase sigma factor (sigma-70 family)
MTRNHRGRGGRFWGLSGVDAEFYAYHVGHVRKRLRRMGLRGADVDDLVQDTFIIAQRYWSERPLDCGRQRNWLQGIAWRLAMNFCRRKRHEGELLEIGCWSSFVSIEHRLNIWGFGSPSAPFAPNPSAEDLIYQRQVFDVAFAGVTDRDLEMLAEYFLDGITVTEIAARYGLARSTAWSKLQKLRRDAAKRMAAIMV